MRTKRVIFLIICTLLLFLILGGIAMRDIVLPVQVDIFLPEPDAMTCYLPYKDERALSDGEFDRIYESFMFLMQNIESCDSYWTDVTQSDANKYKREYPCLELEYRKRHRYVGTLGTEKPLSQKPFVFDAALLVLQEEHIVVIIKQGSRYCGIDDMPKALHFGPGYATFRAEVLSLIA